MALTNPTKLIDVQRLSRFKEKTDAEYASKTELSNATKVATETAVRDIVRNYTPS